LSVDLGAFRKAGLKVKVLA